MIFIVTQVILSNGFSQDCSVNFFSKSYTGDGFKLGGSQGDRLTILPDSSMIMCNSRFIARIYKNAEVAWSKSFNSSGGNTSNAIADYDGGIVCAIGNSIIKFDTSGNIIYQKKMHFDMDNGYDITNSESFRDIAMLENGDKVVLYEDFGGRYGGYLLRFDRDMTVIKWCKNLRFNDNINFTNMLIEGGKIVLAGLCKENYYGASLGFLASVDWGNGSLIRTGYFNCPNLGSLRSLYKGNGQYFLSGTLLNQTFADGRYCYIRIDSLFNVLAIRRIVGYTDNFGTTFSFAPQSDNSLYGMIGRGLTATIFNIDKQDSINWFQGYLIGGYPHDVKQNTEALFFAADWDYNAVGVGAKSTFTIYKTDFNGNISNNCMSKLTATFATNKYNFSKFTPAVTLQLTNKVCILGNGNLTNSNYPLVSSGCSYNSVCNSVKLIGDTAICNGLPVLFKGRRNSACKSPVSWSIIPHSPFTVVNDSVISVNFLNNGNYKIISQINDRCNVYKDSINVHVNSSGLLDMPNDSILCAGNAIKLSAGNQFKTYQWQDASADSFFVVNQPGKYFITVKDYCDKMYSDTININPANFYFSLGKDTVKCNSDSLIFKATSGFYNYLWPYQYNLKNVNDSTVIVYPHVDTVYIATAEKMPGCFVRDTVRVVVNRSPLIKLGNDTTLCSNEEWVLDAGMGFSSYLWSNGSSLQSIKILNSGLYSIRAKDLNGCYSTDTILVERQNPPSFSLGADTTLCTGKAIVLKTDVFGTTLWQDGSTQQQFTVVKAGLYWLQLNKNGCSFRDTIFVNYKPLPLVSLGNDTTICEGVVKVLTVNPPYTTIRWQNSSSASTLNVSSAGTYSVVVDLNGCTTSDTIHILQKMKPRFDLGKDTFLCIGETLPIKVEGNATTYFWSTGATTSSYTIAIPGKYKLTGTNSCGTFSDELNVNIGVCNIDMPTAFTPNNDGLNDLFRIKYPQSIKSVVICIFNRFGQRVFTTTDKTRGWDGTVNGMPQNSGNYIWTINYETVDGVKGDLKGSVLLLR